MQALAEVKARLATAEDQRRRTSRKSSPPSQDNPGRKAASEAEQGRPKRRARGARGHRRPWLPVEAVEPVVVHRPTPGAKGEALLVGDGGQPYRHQVTELPSLKALSPSIRGIA